MPLLIRTKHFPPRPYAGISLCGLIIFRQDVVVTEADIRHEAIHHRQQREWLFVVFFLLYLAEFMVLLVRYRKWHTAYRHISFEQEAYAHQQEPDYLARRRMWANYRPHS